MKSICYIPQEPMKRVSGKLVPVMDFRRSAEYGAPKVCLPPGLVALSPAVMTRQLKEALKDFSDDDYLIAVGDPTVIAVASAICSDLNRGKIKMLKWDKEVRRYIEVQINLHQ